MRPILCLLASILLFLTKTVVASVTINPLDQKDKTIKDFPFVGSLINTKNFSAGSGTVIGDGSFVLTSKHVITHNGDPNGMVLDPVNFVFILNDKIYNIDKIYADNPNDIAILKLKEKSPDFVFLYNGENIIGKSFYGVGYGKSSTNPKYDSIVWDIPYGTKRIFKNTVSGFSDTVFIQNNKLNMVSEYFFCLKSSLDKNAIEGEGIFGPGDSGGGIFVENSGRIELVGVIKALTLEKPIIGLFVNIKNCKNWIEKIVPNSFSPKIYKQKEYAACENRNNSYGFTDNSYIIRERRRRFKTGYKNEKMSI